jgi:hypothetical protein
LILINTYSSPSSFSPLWPLSLLLNPILDTLVDSDTLEDLDTLEDSDTLEEL